MEDYSPIWTFLLTSYSTSKPSSFFLIFFIFLLLSIHIFRRLLPIPQFFLHLSTELTSHFLKRSSQVVYLWDYLWGSVSYFPSQLRKKEEFWSGKHPFLIDLYISEFDNHSVICFIPWSSKHPFSFLDRFLQTFLIFMLKLISDDQKIVNKLCWCEHWPNFDLLKFGYIYSLQLSLVFKWGRCKNVLFYSFWFNVWL